MANKKNSPWNDEARVAELLKLVASGLSAAEVAAAMGGGLTRNAVLGRIHRMGLSKPINYRPKRKPRQQATNIGGRALKLIRRKTGGQPKLPVHDIPEPIAPNSLELTILEIGTGQCRYPTRSDTPFFFCGHATSPQRDGSPYCEFHHRMCFQSRALPVVRPSAKRNRAALKMIGVSQLLQAEADFFLREDAA